MSQPQVNGEVPHSAFLDHLNKYPIVNDSVNAFKNNPIGGRSLAISNSAYETFAKPVIPYLSRPYQYVSPYVKKVDDLGDKGLGKVDEKFPAVQKPTADLYADVQSLITLPYRTAIEGKDHVIGTYNKEFKRIGASGNNGTIMTYGKALFGTTITIFAESLSAAQTYMNKGKEEVKSSANN